MRLIKYLFAILFPVVAALAMLSHDVTVNYWGKKILKKDDTEVQKKRNQREILYVWIILTVASFVYAIFFAA